MRVVIVDDELLARRGIRQLLADHADAEIVAECPSGATALAAVRNLSPDLIFLDVQMPEMDGFEVVRRIGVEQLPSVIFVTAYDEFAVNAFEASAVDYLMKPVAPERFSTAMRRVRERQSEAAAIARVAELQDLLRQVTPVARQPLLVTTAKGTIRIDPDEIDWIGADDYYAVLHVGAKHYLLRESLASLGERLPSSRFVRVHRSAIVNCSRVKEIRQGAVVLRDGTTLMTSRRRRAAVRAALSAAPAS